MINLIKNELMKIFKKKGIYITFIIVFAFMILINALMSYAKNSEGYLYYYDDTYIEDNRQYLSTLDPDNSHEIGDYLHTKTEIDIYELSEKYGTDSWQSSIIRTKVYEYIYDSNRYTYGAEKDEVLLAQVQAEYNEIIKKLDNDDWKYFAETELDDNKASLEILNNQKKETEGRNALRDIEEQIFNTELQVEILEMRISKDIKYGNDYLNNALGMYEFSKMSIRTYEQNSDKTYEDEKSYQISVEQLERARYTIDNGVDLDEIGLRVLLMDFFNSYDLFIIILIVMIAGSIVSDEFSKGTVKLWLVRPHSRIKLLLAKFITTMIMILIIIAILLIMQLIIGGVVFGFDSLEIPAVVYDFNKSELVEMNVAKYMFVSGLANMSFFVLIAVIAFAISTLFTSTSLAITISILGYISNDIINMLVAQFDIKFMKYFITMNWNLDWYLFGHLPEVEYVNFGFSAVMCILYFIAMIVPTFIVFKKKNIKNV